MDYLLDLLDSIEIPQSLGRRENLQKPQTDPLKGAVVCVANLPAHVGVQRNISDILELLISHHGFELVCFEGESGAVDAGGLYDKPYDARWAIANDLLEKGMIHAIHYLTFTRPHLKMRAHGVDDAEAYQAQLDVKLRCIDAAAIICPMLKDVKEHLLDDLESLLSPDMGRYCRLLASHDAAQVNFTEYFESFLNYATLGRIAIPDSIRCEFESEKRSQIWHEQAHDRMLRRLPASIKSQMIAALDARERAFSELPPQEREMARKAPSEYYPRLSAPRRAAIDATTRTLEDAVKCLPGGMGELDQALVETETAPTAERGVLDTFASSLRWVVAGTVASAPLDRPLAELLEFTDAIEKFFLTKLLTDQSLELLSRKPGAIVSALRAGLEKVSEATGGTSCVSDPSIAGMVAALEGNWKYPEAFYRLSRSRSGSMSEHTLEAMRDNRVDRAVLITGGFHVRDCVESLRSNYEVGSLTIFPAVDVLPSDLDTRFAEMIRPDPRRMAHFHTIIDKSF